MEEKVLAKIQKQHMITSGDTVIVGLSGGADSVALFHFLWAHAQVLGIRLMAAHFEHGLRGEESLRDADFVEELCRQYQVELRVGRGNMSNRVRPPGVGTEAFARTLRYTFFEELAREQDALVATAHTLNDNAETVLFHAIRGSGPRGLAGIAPVRRPFIRPLLDVTRQEVEAYCQRVGFSYVEDSTNRDVGFSRNRLRQNVMPELEAAHPGALQALDRLSVDMRTLSDWLREEALCLLRQARLGESGEEYDAGILNFAPAPVRLEALALLAGHAADRAALARLEALLAGKGTAVQLAEGKIARRQGGRLRMEHGVPEAMPEYQVPLRPGEVNLPGGFALEVKIIDAQSAGFVGIHNGENEIVQNFQKDLTFWADYDKIVYCSVFRTRCIGDRFTLPKRNVTKSVKKWMNEEKIPLERRARMPLLAAADGSDVQWIWSEGFSRVVQPDDDTKTLLMIRQIIDWPDVLA